MTGAAGGLRTFCFLSLARPDTVNKESKEESVWAGEAGVWRLRLYICTVRGGGCSQTETETALVYSGHGAGVTQRVMRVRGWTPVSIRLTYMTHILPAWILHTK